MSTWIPFCSVVKKLRTDSKWRTVKRSDCVRCRCPVECRRQVSRNSSRIEENECSSRANKMVSSIGPSRTYAGSDVTASVFGAHRAFRTCSVMVEQATASFPSVRTRSSWIPSSLHPTNSYRPYRHKAEMKDLQISQVTSTTEARCECTDILTKFNLQVPINKRMV
jgi:hypothetical protein